MNKLAILGVLLVGMLAGAAAASMYYGKVANIVAEVVAPSGGGGGGSQQGGLGSTIMLNVGQLVAGQYYEFDDVKGYTWLNTGSGGSFEFTLDYNSTVFDYVRVKVDLSEGVDYEFYLDTNNPTFTVNLPANMNIEIEVELEEISVSPDASPGSYSISIDLYGP